MNILKQLELKKKKKSKHELAQEQAQAVIVKTNEKIDELGRYTEKIYVNLEAIQKLFDVIRNVPHEQRIQYEQMKEVQLSWKQQAEKIEADYRTFVVKNVGEAAAGVGAGVAVVALGPTVAMGVATTFGVASTGTAISTLSGAAATNAALAWLGGGALVAGGGGMAAGEALLALVGPVGWVVAGMAILGSSLLIWKARDEKKCLETVYTLVSKRDTKSYEEAIVEINERITRIQDENKKLAEAIQKIKTFGTDYNRMTEAQQYELGAYVNLMQSSTQLLVNPIVGLLPKYTEKDFEDFISNMNESETAYYMEHKALLITLANLFYEISLDKKEKKILTKSLKENKNFLHAVKKDFDEEIIKSVEKCLQYKSCGVLIE